MSVVKHFIEDSIKKAEIEEFLQNEFERAGYGGVSITKTPLGTHLVIYTMRPGLVIGRGGETIRALAKILEENFNLPSPQISVAEIEIPELNAYVVASRIASALKRGVHYRRAGFWGLTQAMEAGALGIEIIISGKLRTDRARYEKFREGYLPKSGDPPRKYMRKAELHVHLKPGTLGVKVRLLPPDAQFPDKVNVHIIEEDMEKAPERKIIAKEPVAEPETMPAQEPAVEVAPELVAEKEPVAGAPALEKTEPAPVKEEKVAEPEIIIVDDKVEPEKTEVKEAAPVPEAKVVEEKKPAAKKKEVADKPAEPEVVPEPEKKVTKEKATEAKKAPAKKAKVARKKAAKPEAAPVKEEKKTKKKATKKATKPKAPSAEENKEAEE